MSGAKNLKPHERLRVLAATGQHFLVDADFLRIMARSHELLEAAQRQNDATRNMLKDQISALEAARRELHRARMWLGVILLLLWLQILMGWL